MRAKFFRCIWLVLGVVVVAFGDNAMAQAPKTDAQVSFGVDMARKGLWSEALFRFQQADKARPNDPHILNNLAVAYEAVGQYEEALKTYKMALQSSPSNRELKRNYSTFMEFYQAFHPAEEDPEEARSQAEADQKEVDQTASDSGARERSD